MSWLLLLFLASGNLCQEEFKECKQEHCFELEGIEWSQCVDRCLTKLRKCEQRRER